MRYFLFFLGDEYATCKEQRDIKTENRARACFPSDKEEKLWFSIWILLDITSFFCGGGGGKFAFFVTSSQRFELLPGRYQAMPTEMPTPIIKTSLVFTAKMLQKEEGQPIWGIERLSKCIW
jgi:hypothetical protein